MKEIKEGNMNQTTSDASSLFSVKYLEGILDNTYNKEHIRKSEKVKTDNK